MDGVVGVIQKCETCVEMGKGGRKANRQVEGVWMCVDCIVSMNRDEIQKTGMVRAVLPAGRSDGLSVDPSPIATTKSLVATLENVMAGLVKGTITPDKANAVCKVSTEWLKANELLWRMTK